MALVWSFAAQMFVPGADTVGSYAIVSPLSANCGSGSPRDEVQLSVWSPGPPAASLLVLAIESTHGATEYGLIVQEPSLGSRPASPATVEQSEPPSCPSSRRLPQ